MEYEIFRLRQGLNFVSDFERVIAQLEVKRKKRGEDRVTLTFKLGERYEFDTN